MISNKLLFTFFLSLFSITLLSSSASAQIAGNAPAGNTNAASSAKAPWESAYSAPSFGGGGGQGPIREVFCDIAGQMEGSLGGLLASAAVVLAVGGAAFGDFSNAKRAMIVGIGGATILAGNSLYFGDMGCGGAAAGNTAVERAANNTPDAADEFNPFDEF